MSVTEARKPGRMFFANPGPTNIPESVLKAVQHHSVDFNDAEFIAIYDACVAGLKRVLKTSQEVFMYTASGHGAWEASLVNLFSPGDLVLIPETGNFSESWTRMAEGHGLRTRTLAADWRRGMDMVALRQALEADSGHEIKAVGIVHNETATGLFCPIDQVRAVLDSVCHPALLPAGADAADRHELHRRVEEGAGGPQDRKAGEALLQLDGDDGPPAQGLCRHRADHLVLWPAGIAAADRAGGAGAGVRAPPASGRGGASLCAALVRQ
jgi:hypothetical protein